MVVCVCVCERDFWRDKYLGACRKRDVLFLFFFLNRSNKRFDGWDSLSQSQCSQQTPPDSGCISNMKTVAESMMEEKRIMMKEKKHEEPKPRFFSLVILSSSSLFGFCCLILLIRKRCGW
jgi:hypothetical protein